MPWLLRGLGGVKYYGTPMREEGTKEIWERMRAHEGAYTKEYRKAFDRERFSKGAIRFLRQPKVPIHALPAGQCFMFSDTVKCVLEALEPGVHDPIRVKILNKDGSPWHEPFWYYRDEDIPSLDAVDLDASDVWTKTDERTGETDIGTIVLPAASPKLNIETKTFLDDRIVRGHHFFRERRGLKWFFFSDAFVEKMRAAKILKSFVIAYVGLSHVEAGGDLS